MVKKGILIRVVIILMGRFCGVISRCDVMFVSIINIVFVSVLVISNVWCSGLKKKCIMCGIIRLIKLIELVMLMMVVVISVVVVKRIRCMCGIVIFSEVVVLLLKVNVFSVWVYYRQIVRFVSIIIMISWNLGQWMLLKLFSSQNIILCVCCVLVEVLMV